MAQQSTKQRQNGSQKQRTEDEEKIAQIAADAAERVADETDLEEEIIVTIEEYPPGVSGLRTVSGQSAVELPVIGFVVNLMEASFNAWNDWFNSMLEYQRRTVTSMLDRGINQSKEIVNQSKELVNQ